MFAWFKKLRGIVAGYDRDEIAMLARIEKLERIVRDRTEIAADIGFKGLSHVIVVGRYRNNDYVQTFELHPKELDGLIDELRERQRYGKVSRIDAPPVFKAVFERDRF